MRLVLIKTALLLLVIAYGCSRDSDGISAANEGNTADEGSAVAESGGNRAPRPIAPGDNDGVDQADTDDDGVDGNTDSDDISEDFPAPIDDMNDSNGDSLYERALAAAASLDEQCLDDCQKDLMCNPDDALTIPLCWSEYCRFFAILEELGPQAASESLIACFEAQTALSGCFVAESCEAYTSFYYSEEAADVCISEIDAFDIGCAEFTSD